MRTINQLTSQFEKVWFVIDDEYKSRFVDECNRSGYVFNNGKHLTTDNCGRHMAIHSEDKTLWYIDGRIWSMSLTRRPIYVFTSSPQIHLPVDYRALADGEQRYVYGDNRELVALEDYSDANLHIPMEMFKCILRNSFSGIEE